MSKEFQINHLAKLSYLKLSQQEEKKYSAQIAEILTYFKSLQNAKTDNTKIFGQIAGLENVWREDKVKQGLDTKDILTNAKNTHSNFFKVQAILENRDN